MKIKVVEKSIDEVMALPGYSLEKPVKQNRFFRWLLKTVSAGDLKQVNFTCRKIGMEKLGKEEPCLVLMNHSSFIDLKIASTVLYPRQFHIVCTADGFVGKEWLMRHIGCIPTFKFVTDMKLVKDMVYCLRDLKSSVLMYPEASYTFDGTATPLPQSVGKLLKVLKVPVVMIRTNGAFTRDPLYNNLQLRQVDVSATVTYLLSPEQIKEKSVSELNGILKEQFTLDNFRWQQENRIAVTEDFRADGLHRVLYKCPVCGAEGKTEGKGTGLTCKACGKGWTLDEYGYLRAVEDSSAGFTHVPDWYAWERACVKKEIEEGRYLLDIPVDILAMVNTDAVYRVGEGRLVHDREGFHLTGCEGKIDYRQSRKMSYSLYSDYFWYEIGDMISIGDTKIQYYCFPKKEAIVAKARLAAEEMFKMSAM